MILRILVLICAVFVTPIVDGMPFLEFTEKFENMCFRKNINEPFHVNGQEIPLANTMENFISLAEEFEAANPTVLLKEELLYFIQNYIFENIQFSTEASGDINIGLWKPEGTDLSEIATLWEPDRIIRILPQQVNDPFSNAEKCSLYHMISHSIVDKPKDMKSSLNSYNNANDSSSDEIISNLIEDFYPQEIGVVAVRGSDMAVSLSRVLVGLYVGLNENRRRSLTEFERIAIANLPDNKLPQERTVDPLYTLTIAEVLMLPWWVLSRRQGLAPNGYWVSSNSRMDDLCPMVYRLDDATPAYSYSTVRGAADGLILGMAVSSIEDKKPNAKLSQILRMYYSREGIAVEQMTGEFRTHRISFCNREKTMESLEEDLEQQMMLYGYLVSEKFSDVDYNLLTAKNMYFAHRENIYQNILSEPRDYCSKQLSLDRPDDLPRETNLDIFVLMDSRISENSFHTQQRITGYLAKNLDLRHTGSRMTILLDQKINDASNTAKINLKTVVVDTYSSTCAACNVVQLTYEPSTLDRDQIIAAIDQMLEERKANETKDNGVNGKVVIYFNFETHEKYNNKILERLENALRYFHLRHLDTLLLGVGMNQEVLEKFTRNDPYLVFWGKHGAEEEVATNIYEKLSIAPGLLQYPDCEDEDGRSESSAVYENFITPLAVQHWQMPAKYFYKSTRIKVVFESQNGPIKVCHNRATMTPEHDGKFCMNTTGTAVNNALEFRFPNPCEGLTKETCSPFYFAIMGVGRNENSDKRPRHICNDIKGHWCNTLDDIKFKVSHEGIRCSGCLVYGAPPLEILLALLLSYFLHKNF